MLAFALRLTLARAVSLAPSIFVASALIVVLGLANRALAECAGPMAGSFSNGQDPSSTQEADEASDVRGKIVLPENPPISVELPSLTVTLAEQLEYTPLPLPPDWGSRSDDERRKWIEEFQASDAGKEFMAAREAQQEAQRKFDIRLEEDGSFELFDVPTGSYHLIAHAEREQDGRHYLVELFAQIQVSAVDELPLQPLSLQITRKLTAGEPAPAFEVPAVSADGSQHSLDDFRGKPLLLHFWSAENPNAAEDFAALRSIRDALHEPQKLELLSICVDEAPDGARTVLESENIEWPAGHAAGWSHPACQAYGIRLAPAVCLIGADGNIVLTDADFVRAAIAGQHDQIAIVREALEEGQGNAPKD